MAPGDPPVLAAGPTRGSPESPYLGFGPSGVVGREAHGPEGPLNSWPSITHTYLADLFLRALIVDLAAMTVLVARARRCVPLTPVPAPR